MHRIKKKVLEILYNQSNWTFRKSESLMKQRSYELGEKSDVK